MISFLTLIAHLSSHIPYKCIALFAPKKVFPFHLIEISKFLAKTIASTVSSPFSLTFISQSAPWQLFHGFT